MDATDSTQLRELVALGCRILGANGHEDYVWGHVSARDPEGRGIWMKASTYGFEEITAGHVILVSFDGEVLQGDRPRHSEWPIHTEVMRSRPEPVRSCTPTRLIRSPSAPPASRCALSRTPARCSSHLTCPDSPRPPISS